MEECINLGVTLQVPSAHTQAERRNVDLQASWRGGHLVDACSNRGDIVWPTAGRLACARLEAGQYLINL